MRALSLKEVINCERCDSTETTQKPVYPLQLMHLKNRVYADADENVYVHQDLGNGQDGYFRVTLEGLNYSYAAIPLYPDQVEIQEEDGDESGT